jgi:broad specificity phosphatase PhoE/adenylate kinase family enzyme
MAPTSVCNLETTRNVSTARHPVPEQGARHFVPVVVVLVGLPASGKTVLAHKLERFLNWSGIVTQIFKLEEKLERHSSEYMRNIFADKRRHMSEVQKENFLNAAAKIKFWLQGDGEIAILDGNNLTMEERQFIKNHVVGTLKYKLLFVECIIDDTTLLEKNIKETLELSDAYKGLDFKEAYTDIKEKIKTMKTVYQQISHKKENTLSFIKFHNAGENIDVHRLDGPYQTKVLSFISSFRPVTKTLYFSRHGESEANLLGKIGGDTNLSPRGAQYADLLSSYFNSQDIPELKVWTSEKKRTKQTAQGVVAPVEHIVALNELDAGICEGMTYEEMQEKFPQEFAWRDQDKLRYRYPWGESYLDIVARLEPVILELEREDSVLVVSHQAVLRCVLGYFLRTRPDDLPYLNVPLHTIIKLTTRGYECSVEFVKFDIGCVDTYRKQPKNCSADRPVEEVAVTIPKHFESLQAWQSSSPLVN